MDFRKYFNSKFYGYRDPDIDNYWFDYYDNYYRTLYSFGYYNKHQVEGVLMDAHLSEISIIRAVKKAYEKVEKLVKFVSSNRELSTTHTYSWQLKNILNAAKLYLTFVPYDIDRIEYYAMREVKKFNSFEENVAKEILYGDLGVDFDEVTKLDFVTENLDEDKSAVKSINNEVNKRMVNFINSFYVAFNSLYVDVYNYVFDDNVFIKGLENEMLMFRYLVLNKLAPFKELIAQSEKDVYSAILSLIMVFEALLKQINSSSGFENEMYSNFLSTGSGKGNNNSENKGKKETDSDKGDDNADANKGMESGRFKIVADQFAETIIRTTSILKKLEKKYNEYVYSEFIKKFDSKLYGNLFIDIKHLVKSLTSDRKLGFVYSNRPPISLDLETIMDILNDEYQDIDFDNKTPMDVVVLLDTSGSMGNKKVDAVRLILFALSKENVRIRDIIPFNTELLVENKLSLEELIASKIKTDGGTDIVNSLRELSRLYPKSNYLLLTDLEDEPEKIEDDILKRLAIIFVNDEKTSYVEKWKNKYGERIVYSINPYK